MKRLLTHMILALALFMAQPVQAQQQDAQKENMGMMQDSTMMQKMMENPQMHKKMMRMMIQNMHGDSTMSGMEDMMDGKMGSMCMKMCMNMMGGDMDMDMKKMHEKKDSTQMKKSEG